MLVRINFCLSRLFDDLQPPDTPKKHLLARLLPRSLKALKGRREVQNVLAPLYNLQYTPGAKVISRPPLLTAIIRPFIIYQRIDVISRVMFPVSFGCLNIIYW